jgi:hypothetical protein
MDSTTTISVLICIIVTVSIGFGVKSFWSFIKSLVPKDRVQEMIEEEIKERILKKELCTGESLDGLRASLEKDIVTFENRVEREYITKESHEVKIKEAIKTSKEYTDSHLDRMTSDHRELHKSMEAKFEITDSKIDEIKNILMKGTN